MELLFFRQASAPLCSIVFVALLRYGCLLTLFTPPFSPAPPMTKKNAEKCSCAEIVNLIGGEIYFVGKDSGHRATTTLNSAMDAAIAFEFG